MTNGQNNNILKVSRSDQFKTVDELLKKSRPDSIYYTLLILSIFIISAGLLLSNMAIVIGGMLVTPVLTPILAVCLACSVGNINAIRNRSILLMKSFLLIIGVSALMTLLFGSPPTESFIMDNTMRTAVLYFIVAVTAGVSATFAWVRKEVADVLPGIAIAVSLVPPIALVGIWFGAFDIEMIRFYLLVFIFNLFGTMMGSLVVFNLLKFYKSKGKVREEEKEEDAKAVSGN